MKSFIIALQFLTIIRVKNNTAFTESDSGRATVYFPFAGLLIGGILALLAYFCSHLFLHSTTVLFVIIAEIIITGGLHLDGLMDTCDGILARRGPEKALEIMKDSRVGAMGILGLVVLLLLKISLLLEASYPIILVLLVLMPLCGRWTMVYLIYFHPSARKSGLGSLFKKHTKKVGFFIATAYTLIALVVLWFFSVKLLMAIPLTGISIVLIGRKINEILGGHTGDTYGMMSELTEVLFLFWCILLLKI